MEVVQRFTDLSLSAAVLRALQDIGYESPSPIQAATIPALLAGSDLVGQAQTGTGKTAAFALPILTSIDPKIARPQALILAPTRELAIQVAEAFQRYAAHIRGFHVLPVYGGQSYEPQLKALRRGVHVVVGTPGRLLDHMRRGTLKFDQLKTLVLDEADEMLRMGFIDDVEAILKETPPGRQVALFSATMPPAIRRIAQSYLRSAVEVTIAAQTTTAPKIRQRFCIAGGMPQKLDLLTRLLESEPFDAMIVFARTKQATAELAEKIAARGFAAAALNGDVAQNQRERTIAQLRDGRVDILIATDVAARGLDVERISHVINFDVPYDTESYVHRIGRTGRAGRSGEAILFIAPRERSMLKMIERATRQSISPMDPPSAAAVEKRRMAKLLERIEAIRTQAALAPYISLLEDYAAEKNLRLSEVAAALAVIAQGPAASVGRGESGKKAGRTAELTEPPARELPEAGGRSAAKRRRPQTDLPMERYRIEVGQRDGVKPSNIVGAIANEAGLDSEHIGRVEILDNHSFVGLPVGMPEDVFRVLTKARICGKAMQLSLAEGPPASPGGKRKGFRPDRGRKSFRP